MESYLNYIIESGISLGVFTLLYWLVLRQETFLNISRFYLMLALLFSTLLPFITIHFSWPGRSAGGISPVGMGPGDTNLLESVTVFASGLPARVGQRFLSFSPSLWFYKAGAIVALVIILAGLMQLGHMFSKNRVFKLKRARLILTRKPISPYSFFNLIYINSELPLHENWKTMVHHEVEHARQGHSFDVLFIDCMMVFQWFNPFYWIIRRLVRENHEFLADRAVLARCGISAGNYKALLLNQVIGGNPIITSNFFSIQTIKNRFKMMTKNKTGKLGFLKYMAVFITALAITILFACEKVNPTDVQQFDAEKSVLFRDHIIALSEVGNQNVEKMMLARIESKAIIAEMPQFEGVLPEGEILMMFDYGNSDDQELAKRLKVNIEITKKSKEIVGLQNDPDVFAIVEDMPEFPGGEVALRQFIASHVEYPEIAKKNGIQGRVYVQFVINQEGLVENPRIARGVDPSLDEEALRVIGLSPAWKPGKQRGQAVKVSYTIPIIFKLQ